MEIGRHYTERFIREPLFRKRDIEEHKMIGFICRSKSRSSDLRLIKRSFIVYSEGGVMSGYCMMSNRKTSLFSVCFSFLFSYPLFDFLLMDYRALVSNHDCGFQKARRCSLSFPISVFQKIDFISFHIPLIFTYRKMNIWEDDKRYMDGLYSKSFMRFFYSKLLSCVSFFVSFSSPLFWLHLLFWRIFVWDCLLENSLIDFGCSEGDFDESDCVEVWIGLFIVML